MAITPDERPATTETAKIIYVLYLVAVVVGITSIIGVIMAYINKDEAPEWLRTHYQFQIRTFWIGFLYACIGFILAFVLIGFLVLLFTVVWLIIRCVKGLKYIDRKEAYPEPTTWLF